MELLIIKSGRDYIRFKDDTYLFVSLDKASVYPFDQMDVVQQHAACLMEKGFQDVCIKKLVLEEREL